ncbi:hypothetical protein SCLCIDRAFT_484198 [Scleroderma citrinum Foug A]|uniref:Uncharacterized protein n=1 Tax=Scleroderma citrinum Foug A TaxID=1036808 RepID=A0A0C3CWF3_9AGAM|nr:hypothetical protein SCLCIDRAFT_484198 [Scleroderma citrinum Foug A]
MCLFSATAVSSSFLGGPKPRWKTIVSARLQSVSCFEPLGNYWCIYCTIVSIQCPMRVLGWSALRTIHSLLCPDLLMRRR